MKHYLKGFVFSHEHIDRNDTLDKNKDWLGLKLVI